MMSGIKGKNTRPEMQLRQGLHARGLRYRLHARDLAGRPDLVFPARRAVLFAHGCFWHGHTNCQYFTTPKTNTQWWTNKINRNKANDKKAVKALRKDGWRVITVWECKLKSAKADKTLIKLLSELNKCLF